ncbi:hypothetical protein RC79_14580 [Pectobacterium brasiliense]|uniref:hypothetical protein n=1 Tax=Pectobacterium brasiliense TaxID=180957 RepID=UPI00057E5F3D|nr:hypothetical protein [Pectobacterium brasiliense]KHS72453.1 hypothetical protein RC79_14580 [Pectobacterium brasiliense]
MKKYIYIDTNIISDFKSFTPDKWQSFNKVQKKYHFPFSHAHLFDLKNSPEKYLIEDLDLLERISDRYGINEIDENGKFVIKKLNSKLYPFFNSVIETEIKDEELAKKNRLFFLPGYDKHKIELSKMHKDSFLTKMIDKNNGILDGNFPNLLMTYLTENMDSPNVYKSLRKQVQDLISHAKKYNTLKNLPKEFVGFLEIFSGSIKDDQIFEKLVDYRKWTLKFTGKDFSKLSQPEQIVDIYMSLDIVKGFSEDISKKNRWVNMYRDAQHCGNASQSKYYITKEQNNKNKFNFIMREFNLKCREITLEDLLNRIS